MALPRGSTVSQYNFSTKRLNSKDFGPLDPNKNPSLPLDFRQETGGNSKLHHQQTRTFKPISMAAMGFATASTPSNSYDAICPYPSNFP
ncbi:hypothetical protein L3X38_005346 [Prunus dulcis]|uniref:Uncharacterized protein n=1 Tax=Prunus dulcis TaxID=3755 RepID=A0AAD4ZQR7_PRUDU|nr:hypothetical protein L3X38_005346 [Prunus dulcis]